MEKVNKDKIFLNGECKLTEFEQIFKKYYRQLFLYAYGFIMDEMEAEDIVQEAFSSIWEKRHTLPQQLDIRSYLYSMVKHACIHYFRRLRLTDEYKKKQLEALLISCMDDPYEDGEEVIRSVKIAMQSLTEQQAHIVRLHIHNGLTYHEIANQLNISENTVRTHLKRAYRILRQYLSCFFIGIDIFF